MTYRILVENLPDGSLAITYPSPQLLVQMRTFDAALAYLKQSRPHPAHETSWEAYQAADTYWHDADPALNALTFDPAQKRFTVNMERARLLHMRNLRLARDRALAALDAREIEAQSKGDDTLLSQVQAKKQALRDLPATLRLDLLRDPASLKDHWPEELRG